MEMKENFRRLETTTIIIKDTEKCGSFVRKEVYNYTLCVEVDARVLLFAQFNADVSFMAFFFLNLSTVQWRGMVTADSLPW